MNAYHTSVMLDEALSYLAPRPGGTYVDATLGGGGYSAAILDRCAPDGRVIGIDRDPDALEEARRRLGEWGSAFLPVRGNFADLCHLLDGCGIGAIDGAVFDLGVSSHQLDQADRGFSFRADAPLDMRMDRSQGRTAADLIASLPEADLVRILRDYGEERWAPRIARFIAEGRARNPVRTTGDLVRIVEAAVPKAARPKEIHVATRTFQALRIAVNEELRALEEGLDAAVRRLHPGGRLIVISYHSLEDRIVKGRIAGWENPCICPPDLPVCGCGRRPIARSLTRKAVTPTEAEIARNPRSRSARLRAAERLGPEGSHGPEPA